MIRRSTMCALCAAVALAVACESTPKPKAPEPEHEPVVVAAVALDADALIQTAELLRDREFEKPPTFEAVDSPDHPALQAGFPGCAGRCDEERRWLTRIVFGGTSPVVPAAVARWDGARNVVVWNRSSTAQVARAAVLAELVRALDGIEPAPVTTWDGYLTSTALQRGAGVFVAALDLARRRSDRVNAKQLAMRPETLFQLDFGANRFADGFATREGYAFVAALIRSGGWSAVELAHAERPTRSLQIVRPDRYLAGDQPGEWSLAPEIASARARAGFDLAMEGTVGPALFVEWLSRHVPAAVARAGYIGFESDHYQIFAHADGRWAFDWVSLWSTPSTAQQVVEALDAGLKQRADGARFSVLRKGATVAVVGASGNDDNLLDIGTLLVDALPVFRQPASRGVVFEPTPIDRIQARPQVTSIDKAAWTDEATGLSIDLGALGPEWQALPTTEPNLPWFAKHSGGAVLQYLVEPASLFDPPFDDEAYAKQVRERFVATMALDEPASVTRSDKPVGGALVIDATGKIKDRTAEGPVHLKAWHFSHRGFVTTLSLQAPPARFESIVSELEPLISSIDVAAAAPDASPGVIRFEVED